MKNAIILFVRHPEQGKVKTRLAREIGDEAALKVYIQLLKHTHDITAELVCDKFVFYSESITDTDIWEKGIYYKKEQKGNGLGERMSNAFQELFDNGYQRVIIIGSDCPGLSSSHIQNAFNLLDSFDTVLGPSVDGGYYLLGLNYMVRELFQNKHWSTDTVLSDTLANLKQNRLLYSLLPTLQDIDTLEDLTQLNFAIPY